ncbi:endolytic transglycosylase MltG [Patescibacteria group bacterium]|nr:endolytic transglycosylase MltG [Patescibacteria group bacterium]
MRKFLYPLIIVVVVFVFFGYSYYSNAIHYALNPNGTDRVVVNVHQGDTANDVANQLYEKDLIKSTSIFNLYLKQNNLTSEIKAGRIVMMDSYTLPEIVDALVSGISEEFAVTFLEGWTIEQMAQYLEEEGLTTKEDFLKCVSSCELDEDFIPETYLEGYLYPDTYFINLESYNNERMIGRMVNNLNLRLDEYWSDINASNRSFEDIMIMASIIEREERDPQERPTVAGVLWNRYDNGIGLGADATVLYALGRTSGGLSSEDLQVDSPFNTRKYAGLPPSPICNPSVSSMMAALYPDDTDYFYYLHDSSGEVHYAKTLDGHNANKAKYLY